MEFVINLVSEHGDVLKTIVIFLLGLIGVETFKRVKQKNKGKGHNIANDGDVKINETNDSHVIGQQSGDNPFQIVFNNTVSYENFAVIANEVYTKNNFKFSRTKAEDKAIARVEDFITNFIESLRINYPQGIASAEDPDFQMTLFAAEREYARTGGEDLGKMLISLLVDRTKIQTRDFRQIILTESISIIPKLIDQHLMALAVLYSIRRMRTPELVINSYEDLNHIFVKYVIPVVSDTSSCRSCFQHLMTTGCAVFQSTPSFLSRILKDKYPEIFAQELSVEISKLKHQDIHKFLLIKTPALGNIFKCWNGFSLSAIYPTHIGNAIGHAYLKAKTGWPYELVLED